MYYTVAYFVGESVVEFDTVIAASVEYLVDTGIVAFLNSNGDIVRTYTMANVIKIEYPGLG